jgi:O-antigen ligase
MFLCAHIPLAVLMRQSTVIATLHALGVTAVALWWALSRRSVVRAAYAGSYIMGAEVLWRMNHARVFWEYGKYAVIAVFVVALWRTHRRAGPPLPLLYFVLLLPSVLLTVLDAGISRAVDQFSFNLSGPLALVVSAWFFSRLRLSSVELYRLLLMPIGPAIGIAALAAFSIATSNIEFGRQSNIGASGGFGPNQVSSALGLGALLAFLCVMKRQASGGYRAVMFASMIGLAAQSALTFSRGGLYNAGIGAALAFLCLLRDAGSRIKALLILALLAGVIHYVLWPQLDAFTGGHLTSRFQDTGTTGRAEIVHADLQIWRSHPLFGVGPGQAKELRERYVRSTAAHTEFTRLVAEHGLLGLGSLLLLLAMAARNLRRARTPVAKAVASSVIGWSFFYMLNAGMRTVAPSFLLGLTFARLLPEESRVNSDAAVHEDGNGGEGPPAAGR